MEVRNATARLAVSGEDSAGAVQLLDRGAAQRSAGIVSENASSEGQPLLSDIYYLDRALSPYAEIAKGNISQLLDKHVSVLILADVAKISGDDMGKVRDFVSKGGMLIRFAGDHMTGGSDDLVPVPLRVGGRYLGSAMAWSSPQHLAPFGPSSPFNGLDTPSEVTVSRQVLAEPSAELQGRTWAQLSDGTPLITAQAWARAGSCCSTSPPARPGRRCRCRASMSICSSGCWRCRRARRPRDLAGLTSLPPVSLLDGFGHRRTDTGRRRPIAAKDFAHIRVSPQHPPGLYGAHEVESALNVMRAGDRLTPLGNVAMQTYGNTHARALEPYLLAAAMILLAAGLPVVAVAARLHARETADGWARPPRLFCSCPLFRFRRARRRRHEHEGGAGHPPCLCEDRACRCGRHQSGGADGSGPALKARTSYEPLEPIGVDPEHDDLSLLSPALLADGPAREEPVAQGAVEDRRLSCAMAAPSSSTPAT